MIGKKISHYKILEKLGGGGMGVVYKAEDTKLDRTVALKFLPRHIAGNSEERERFKIEAKAAAALNHPNIATIHAIEETDDEMFIVMEYIDGKELKDKINPPVSPLGKEGIKGGLPTDEVISIATQIAEGLDSAHKKGIVHRDIKSSNVMITKDGKVKIMDFGLAKIGQGAQVTKIGSTIGTAAYMSPEQAKGEELDNRTDIWSFGVVLYEMITGKQPFEGDYEQAIIYSIINDEITPLSKLNPEIPERLDEIILKSLTKNPVNRYQNVNKLLADLKKVLSSSSPGTKSEQPKRIAILPFGNISGDQQSDYLGFALADQVIGAISYSKNILVRPSASIRKFINSVVNLKNIGSELNVDFILTGNYLKLDDLIRLNIELVELNTENLIWSESIKVKFKDAFELQDIVSEKVIYGLRVQFSQDERNRMQADIPKDPLAYEYYLRAISYPVSIEGDELAIEMLKKSVSLDVTYAPAFSELGFRLYQLTASAMLGRKKSIEAEQAFRKALSLNENLLTALWNLSLHYVEIGNSEEAFKLIKHMFRIAPNNAHAHYALGYLYRYAGMLEESVMEVEHALALDAKNPRFRSAGFTFIYLGDYKKAYEVFDLDRESTLSYAWKGMALFLQGQGERAIEYFDQAVLMEPKGYIGMRAAGIRSFIKGENNKGLIAIRQLEDANPSDSDSEHWYLIGNVYALLGDKVGCFRGLQKAIEGGFF